MSPSTWASSLGFSPGSISEWITTSHSWKNATVSNACDPFLGYPEVAIHRCKRAYACHRGRLDKVPLFRFIAKTAASYDVRVVSFEFLLHRKETFRKLVISKCARIVRPAKKVPHGFSASWYNPPDGSPRRPATADEACKGALQEWSKLMTEPPCKCSNPCVSHCNDEFGNQRGTINVEVACNAPPDSSIRLVAQAYMGSPDSGYSILRSQMVDKLVFANRRPYYSESGHEVEACLPPVPPWLLRRCRLHM